MQELRTRVTCCASTWPGHCSIDFVLHPLLNKRDVLYTLLSPILQAYLFVMHYYLEVLKSY
jgi:hypothetical protein